MSGSMRLSPKVEKKIDTHPTPSCTAPMQHVRFGLVWSAPSPWPQRLKVSEDLRHGSAKKLYPWIYPLPWRLLAHGVCPCRDSLTRV